MFEEEIGMISGNFFIFIYQSFLGHFGPTNSIEFQAEGRSFISAGEEGVIRLFKFDNSYWDIDQKFFEGEEVKKEEPTK